MNNHEKNRDKVAAPPPEPTRETASPPEPAEPTKIVVQVEQVVVADQPTAPPPQELSAQFVPSPATNAPPAATPEAIRERQRPEPAAPEPPNLPDLALPSRPMDPGSQDPAVTVAATSLPEPNIIAFPQPGTRRAPDFVPDFGMDLGASADGMARELRSAGDRMRSALERNGAETVALFERALGVLEEQDRRLADFERRLELLHTRLKSFNTR